MRVIRDEIQLCDDCLFAAVNGDVTGVYAPRGMTLDERIAQIDAGLAALGPHLVPHFDSESGRGVAEFSSLPCDCCRSKLAGGRHTFAILGPEVE